MKPHAPLLAALFLALAGCGADPEPEIKALVADCNAFADAVDRKEPAAALQGLADKVKADAARMRGLKATASRAKEVTDRYGADLRTAYLRLTAATQAAKARGAGLPGRERGVQRQAGRAVSGEARKTINHRGHGAKQRRV